jgi:proteasome lid subunit RPN8/RPN11
MTDSLPERLILTQEQAAQVEAHARSEYPREACGLLGGRNGRVESVYPLPNTERSATRYLADPVAQLRAMLEIEDSGKEIVAIYHSHPSSPPTPSDTDLEMAYYPEALYLIISLTDQRRPALRAFSIQEGEIQEMEVSVSDGAEAFARPE